MCVLSLLSQHPDFHIVYSFSKCLPSPTVLQIVVPLLSNHPWYLYRWDMREGAGKDSIHIEFLLLLQLPITLAAYLTVLGVGD